MPGVGVIVRGGAFLILFGRRPLAMICSKNAIIMALLY